MPTPNPIAFTIFNIDIMWYGILITSGMILSTFICYQRAPKHSLDKDRFLNMVLISIPVAIIGARLYYVAFNWSSYSGDFMNIINIRGGGLAIHGGLIWGFITASILCCIWKVRPLNLLDLIAPGVALAQSIGRWGNYFNSEAHGGATDLPWAVTIAGQGYHPTFLYESIWCFILFWVLLYVDNHRKFEGQVLLLYGILYSLERFLVEALRTDSLMIGPFKQAQILSLVVILICILFYILLHKGKEKH